MTSDPRQPLNITSAAARTQARPTMYDERFVVPMRRELTDLGFRELRTSDEVDDTIPRTAGTALVVVNSICGCAARNARPAVRRALENTNKPAHLFTVFAGQDSEATDRARGYFTGYAPSSPSVALLRDGALVWMLERWQIEGRAVEDITADLVEAFEEHCAA